MDRAVDLSHEQCGASLTATTEEPRSSRVDDPLSHQLLTGNRSPQSRIQIFPRGEFSSMEKLGRSLSLTGPNKSAAHLKAARSTSYSSWRVRRNAQLTKLVDRI
jgi:hypothetical protein